jgi:murein DD-endopeptidase MepM/ murein hydrolase activator NlpD
MRRWIDLETVPGLLASGVLLGLVLLPLLWFARLGVDALRSRAAPRAVESGARPPTPRTTGPERAPSPSATARPAPPASPEPAAETPVTLIVPVRGVRRSAIPDTFDEVRGDRRHHALDIRAPRGTPVLAATTGRIVELSQSRGGGLQIYLLDETGRYCLYHAHLLRYARGIGQGSRVVEGGIIAFVGTSGNVSGRMPHLHFAVTRNTALGQCGGEDVNPLTLIR